MISNINDRLLYAIQNYFYTRHKELFSSTFIEPKSKKIHKSPEPIVKASRSQKSNKERKPSSGIRGARKRQKVSEPSFAKIAHHKLISPPLVIVTPSLS